MQRTCEYIPDSYKSGSCRGCIYERLGSLQWPGLQEKLHEPAQLSLLLDLVHGSGYKNSKGARTDNTEPKRILSVKGNQLLDNLMNDDQELLQGRGSRTMMCDDRQSKVIKKKIEDLHLKDCIRRIEVIPR